DLLVLVVQLDDLLVILVLGRRRRGWRRRHGRQGRDHHLLRLPLRLGRFLLLLFVLGQLGQRLLRALGLGLLGTHVVRRQGLERRQILREIRGRSLLERDVQVLGLSRLF